MDQEISFATNQKGKCTLICGTHRYNKHRTNKTGSTLWRCVCRQECIASISLDKTRTIVTRQTKHTCETFGIQNIIHEHVAFLKKLVCKDFRPVQQIFEENESRLREKVPISDHDLLPTFYSLKDTLYRARKSYLNTDRLHHTSTATASVRDVLGKKFLVCEDGATEKIIVFATSLAKKIVKSPGSYFADGTFKSAPPPFYQMYVLHLDIGSSDKCINITPVIYSLLPNKSQETYTRLFRLLKEKLGVCIKYFKCDYELAQINAVQSVFPDAQISGCYHHYNDAIWKHAEKKGLLNTSSGRNITRIAAIIPLVPAQHIPATWVHILEQAPQSPGMDHFRRYFERQWFPKLPTSLLSCAGQRHRTTNALEGWHRRINTGRIPNKPSLYMFIYKLKKESVFWDKRIKDSLFKKVKPNRRPKDIYFDRNYKKLLGKLDRNTISLPHFLKKVIFLQLVK